MQKKEVRMMVAQAEGMLAVAKSFAVGVQQSIANKLGIIIGGVKSQIPADIPTTIYIQENCVNT